MKGGGGGESVQCNDGFVSIYKKKLAYNTIFGLIITPRYTCSIIGWDLVDT